MTPEERAAILLENSELAYYFCEDEPITIDHEKAMAVVVQAIREAKIEAYKEAARATCEYCPTNEPAIERFLADRQYIHRIAPPGSAADDPYRDREFCGAAGIRALIDSLVETVSA
jgi:hypothetical protein